MNGYENITFTRVIKASNSRSSLIRSTQIFCKKINTTGPICFRIIIVSLATPGSSTSKFLVSDSILLFVYIF